MKRVSGEAPKPGWTESDSGRPKAAASTRGPAESQRLTTQLTSATHGLGATLADDCGSDLVPGTQVGRYLVLNKIAAGGMGAVYRAFDPELDRNVAVKVVAVRGDDTLAATKAAVRLVREAKALAQLSHPNVVAIYDVGSFDGDVFIAMALVEGRTLRDFANAAERTLAETVEAFVAAGRGLAAAHKAGIIHRDFKPENVLIGDDGRVQVVDFGIALADDTRTNELPTVLPRGSASASAESGLTPYSATERLTKVGALVGTPGYMSPEQFLGDRIDAKSDQFSFCIALYEALHGERPFAGRRILELRRNVISGRIREPRKESRVPARIRKILARGLSASPDDRYSSMDELLADLSDDPSGRLRRWLGLSIAALAVALVGVAFGAAGEDSDTRCRAAGSAIKAVWSGDVHGAVARAFAASSVSHAADTAQRVSILLDQRANAWAATRQEVCEATWVQGAQSQTLLDLRMHCLDRRLNATNSLVQLLSRDLDPDLVGRAVQAVAALQPVEECARVTPRGDSQPIPADRRQRARLHALQSQIDQLSVMLAAGRFKQGVAAGQPLVVEAEAVGYAPAQAELNLLMGQLWTETGDFHHAEEAYASGLEFAARANDHLIEARLIAKRILCIGYHQDRHREALLLVPHARAAVIQAGSHWQAQAELLHTLGVVYRAKGEYSATLQHLEAALVLYRDGLGHDSPKLAALENTLGITLYQLRRYDAAIAHLEQAHDLWQRSLGPDHPQVATALNNLGMAYQRSNREAEALRAYERALAIFEEVHGPSHPNVAAALTNIGSVLADQQQLAESENRYRRALAICEQRLPARHQKIGIAALNLASVLNKRKRHGQALPLHRRALSILEASLGAQHEYTGIALLGLGDALAAVGKTSGARSVLERALVILAAKQSPELPTVQFSLARQLWHRRSARPRAVELARAARAALAAAPTRAPASRAAVEQWLSDHRTRSALGDRQ